MRSSYLATPSVVLSSVGLVLACSGSGSSASELAGDSGPSPTADGGLDAASSADAGGGDAGAEVSPVPDASDAGSGGKGADAGDGEHLFGVKASGNKLVSTLDGTTVQLRGADYSSMEGDFPGPTSPFNPTNTASTAAPSVIEGYSNANLGTYPWWSYPKAWKMNTFRIPLNEASWLRTYTGRDLLDLGAGTQQPDVTGNLQSAVKQMVSDLIAEGFYVILDLHWSAPGAYLGNTQDQLPDADHAIAFWTSVAEYFGHDPAVIFDVFNEPYPATSSGTEAALFQLLLGGGAQTEISYNSGNSKITYDWNSAGTQSIVDAIRKTGATNLLMVGGAGGATDLSGFVKANGGYFPSDPLNNIAASWHSYGVTSAGTTIQNAAFSGSFNPTTIASQLLAEGIPVVIGECGGAAGAGAPNPEPGALYASQWADANGGNALAWTWNNWDTGGGATDTLLIADAKGTPIQGEGQTWYDWTVNHK